MMRQILIPALLGAALLGGCTSNAAVNAAAGKAFSDSKAGLADAALTPLEDLNLRRDEIPRTLEQIKSPYEGSPGEMSCAQIAAEVTALDGLLRRDWDAGPETDTESLSEKAGGEAADSLLDTVKSEAANLIPYRDVVRQLSGAKAHEQKIADAKERGQHRRTFLKGIGAAKGCDGAAVPKDVPIEDNSPAISYHRPSGGETYYRPDPHVFAPPVASAPRPTPEQTEPVGSSPMSPMPQVPPSAIDSEALADPLPATQDAPAVVEKAPKPKGKRGQKPSGPVDLLPSGR